MRTGHQETLVSLRHSIIHITENKHNFVLNSTLNVVNHVGKTMEEYDCVQY